MVAGLPVGATPLPAGVGVDHSTNSGSIGCRQLRSEKQTARRQSRIQLVLNYPCLHSNPSLVHIDFQYAVHMSRQVNHNTVGERLAVRPGASSAWCHYYFTIFNVFEKFGETLHIFPIFWKNH